MSASMAAARAPARSTTASGSSAMRATLRPAKRTLSNQQEPCEYNLPALSTGNMTQDATYYAGVADTAAGDGQHQNRE